MEVQCSFYDRYVLLKLSLQMARLLITTALYFWYITYWCVMDMLHVTSIIFVNENFILFYVWSLKLNEKFHWFCRLKMHIHVLCQCTCCVNWLPKQKLDTLLEVQFKYKNYEVVIWKLEIRMFILILFCKGQFVSASLFPAK
jgi:hypothetical protein